jgi:hypothetical protein
MHEPAAERAEDRAGDDDGRNGDHESEGERQPQVGVQRGNCSERTGMRRHEAVEYGQARERGDPERHKRSVDPPPHEKDHRNKQDDADLEEQRQSDEGGDAGNCPRQPLGRDAVDNRVRSSHQGR